MAGGNWTVQNKVRPGVYMNIVTAPKALGTLGERGIVSIPLLLPWGEPKVITTIEAGEDTMPKLGYPITDPSLLLVREALKRAQKLLLYRANAGTKAAVTSGNLTVTAKWGGVRGNDLTVVIAENVEDEDLFDVRTLLNGDEVDAQTVANIAGLAANDWVVFSGTGALAASAGAPLIGGANGSTTNQDYLDYLVAIEPQDFNTIALPSTDATAKGAFVSFAKRLRDDEGKKIQVVLENYPSADYEGVISVKNGVILDDGTVLTAAQTTAWVAGATAGANVNESLTYAAYEGAVDVATRYTNSQIIAALQAGEFVFTPNGGRAVVEQDINSLTSFTPDRGKAFSKNRVIRVLDGINNDFVRIFSQFYIGKVSNNADGRNLLRAECVNYLTSLQNINAIQNFDSQADISVAAGNDVDAVLIEADIQPVDSIEKIYMTITVQ
ncbi:phage tail sheath family protein [Cohnella sp. LGH]|uniref:phage tail sheath family protein n=1 Tax=Cohnella sp. LGH TaxID=1619153 RepID=UPI001AD9BA76|nr:phage tail sheath family protein [Cohnella sp. LGH]QTH44963.1 phage tail sheath family protein [Cohnella sp. LGH]